MICCLDMLMSISSALLPFRIRPSPCILGWRTSTGRFCLRLPSHAQPLTTQTQVEHSQPQQSEKTSSSTKPLLRTIFVGSPALVVSLVQRLRSYKLPAVTNPNGIQADLEHSLAKTSSNAFLPSSRRLDSQTRCWSYY